MKTKHILLIAAAVVIIILGVFLATRPHDTTPKANPEEVSAVKEVVTTFGSKLKNVSLLAPKAVVLTSLDTQYGALVAKDLIDAWKKDTTKAPGRMVSSPAPDRIEIKSVVKNPDTSYTVEGSVVEVASAAAGTGETRYPITLSLAHEDSGWKIIEYRRGNTTAPGDKTSTPAAAGQKI